VPLEGIVEIDETWIGGRQRRSKGTAKSNKMMVLGAVERGGSIRLEVREGPSRESKGSYRSFVKDSVDDKAEFIFTDSDYSWAIWRLENEASEGSIMAARNGSAELSTQIRSRAFGGCSSGLWSAPTTCPRRSTARLSG